MMSKVIQLRILFGILYIPLLLSIFINYNSPFNHTELIRNSYSNESVTEELFIQLRFTTAYINYLKIGDTQGLEEKLLSRLDNQLYEVMEIYESKMFTYNCYLYKFYKLRQHFQSNHSINGNVTKKLLKIQQETPCELD